MIASDIIGSHYIIFSNCKFVKGVKRSLICDLQRNTYIYIPNDMYDVVINNISLPIGSIVNLYGVDNEATIIEYFDFLVNSEIVYLCSADDLDNFPQINPEYINSSIITNAIIDISYVNVLYLESIICQLEELGCSDIHLKFYIKVDLDFLNGILRLLEESLIESIELFVIYDDSFTVDLVFEFANKFNRLFKVVIYNAPRFYYSETERINTEIIFLDKDITEKSCGLINATNFVVNIDTYFEAISYNSCLNQKISISKYGEIKNCPSMQKSFGNILQTKISDVVNNPDFIKMRLINKDLINTCNLCEHRYICTDCRAFVDDPNDEFSKPLKCGYNPHTTTWEEWSENPLKKMPILYYKLSSL